MKEGDLEADDKLVESLIGTGDDIMDNEGNYITGGPLFTEAFVWILRGSVKWYENLELTGSADLPVPARAQESTSSFVSESDPVNVWIESACIRSGNSTGPVLFNNFVTYCSQSGESRLDKTQSGHERLYSAERRQQREFIGISPVVSEEGCLCY